MRIALIILILSFMSLRAEDRHYIIVVEGEKQQDPPSTVVNGNSANHGVSPLPERRDAIYESIWRHPDQTYLDSDLGPLPLYTEVTYDQYGNPRPRFPDAMVKFLMDDPTPERAMVYLENQKVRMRRYLQASQVMRDVAAQSGYVTDEAFRGVDRQSVASRDIVADSAIANEYQGVPTMTPEQARIAGLKVNEIPATPGRLTTRYVEVVYLWDWRCPYSMAGYRDFAQIGAESFDREMGPRFIAVSLDNDSPKVRAKLDYLEYTGVLTKKIENHVDKTDLRKSFKVTRTPTYGFFDRRTGKVMRLEGQHTAEDIQKTLLTLVGHPNDNWSNADPRWFRPVKPAIGTDGDLPLQADDASPAIDAKASGLVNNEESAPGSTPAMPASRQIRAWDPNGQSN